MRYWPSGYAPSGYWTRGYWVGEGDRGGQSGAFRSISTAALALLRKVESIMGRAKRPFGDDARARVTPTGSTARGGIVRDGHD